MIGLLDVKAWWLIGGVGAVLVIATLVTFILAAKLPGERHAGLISNLKSRIFAWWIMVGIVTIALMAGETVTILLFLLMSIVAMREFIGLSPAALKDKVTLAILIIAVPLIHYWTVWEHWYGFFAIFIPVYAYLFLPAVSALRGQNDDFMARTAIAQWSLMVCVYALSYAPALLQLPVQIELGKAAAEGSAVGSGGADGARLLLFLIIVVQGSDVLQYIWGKTLGSHPIVPKVSPNKTWEGFIGGVLCATALGAALSSFTPFTALEAAGLSFVSCLLGFAGGLVMSSIKRDRGVKDFGEIIPGHGGMLDRLDSLIFAAPVFFHLTRFFFAS